MKSRYNSSIDVLVTAGMLIIIVAVIGIYVVCWPYGQQSLTKTAALSYQSISP